MIFDEATIRKLQRLSLVAEQVRRGAIRGDRRSSKRGTSLEFADYRNYTPGEDLRRLDWKVYARLDRPFLKIFEEDEDLAVYLLVDGSGSMDWGQGDAHKFTYVRRLAAALGWIAMSGGDQAHVAVLSGETVRYQWGPARGQPGLPRLLDFLERLVPDGSTDLNAALTAFSLPLHRPGLAILISDLFSPQGFFEGTRRLQQRGHQVMILQTLAPEELQPALHGDLRLVDVETRQPQDVTLTGGLLSLYANRLAVWQTELKAECNRREIRFHTLSTSHPWERLVLYDLRLAGIVR